MLQQKFEIDSLLQQRRITPLRKQQAHFDVHTECFRGMPDMYYISRDKSLPSQYYTRYFIPDSRFRRRKRHIDVLDLRSADIAVENWRLNLSCPVDEDANLKAWHAHFEKSKGKSERKRHSFLTRSQSQPQLLQHVPNSPSTVLLTKKDISVLKDIHSAIDIDCDGSVTISELHLFFQILSQKSGRIISLSQAMNRARTLRDKVDIDNDFQITRKEWLLGWNQSVRGGREELEQFLDVWNKNPLNMADVRNETHDMDVLQNKLASRTSTHSRRPQNVRSRYMDVHRSLSRVHKHALEQIFGRIDMDNDGQVTLAEAALFNQNMFGDEILVLDALKDASTMFEAADVDRDKTIGVEEFIRSWQKVVIERSVTVLDAFIKMYETSFGVQVLPSERKVYSRKHHKEMWR
eukprot:260945_1